jgi:lipopolysaccharide/colanic/teichoic acid biosynthesis glycosyltransferase
MLYVPAGRAGNGLRMRSLLLKRCFDLAVVLLVVPLWLPVVLGLAILVRLKLGRPIIFRQHRPGLNNRIFELVKFRTMLNATDASGRPLPDAERLTPFGRLLRASSLDELPELLNVIRGEMSLVGPRPLLIEYLPRYSHRQARRHEVLPGLTGLAQINGRNALTWEQKFEWDVVYVETRSLWLDIRILLVTVVKVLRRDGISAQGDATMPEFKPTIRSEAK